MKKIPWYVLNKENLAVNLGILFGVDVLGIIVYYILEFTIGMSDTGEHTFFPFGGLMLLMAYVFLILFAGWASESQKFNLAVSMGETRKRFFLLYASQTIVLQIINWIVMFALIHFEEWLCGVIVPGILTEASMTMLFPWWTFIVVPFVISGFALFAGGLGLLLGAAARWVMVVLWIVCILGFERLADNFDIAIKLLTLPKAAWFVIVCGLAVAFYVAAAFMMRKQRVEG